MQKKQVDRRIIVRGIMEMTGMTSPKEIQTILANEHNINVTYQTVHGDVTYLREQSNRWLSDTLRTSWNIKLFEVYRKQNFDIQQLRDLKDELAKSDMPVEKKIGKVAFADRIITEQLQFLSDFMTSKGFFVKLKEYIETHDTEKVEEAKKVIQEYAGMSEARHEDQ